MKKLLCVVLTVVLVLGMAVIPVSAEEEIPAFGTQEGAKYMEVKEGVLSRENALKAIEAWGLEGSIVELELSNMKIKLWLPVTLEEQAVTAESGPGVEYAGLDEEQFFILRISHENIGFKATYQEFYEGLASSRCTKIKNDKVKFLTAFQSGEDRIWVDYLVQDGEYGFYQISFVIFDFAGLTIARLAAATLEIVE